MKKNLAVTLASRPLGKPTLFNFALVEKPIPALIQGQVLLEVLFLSLDPYMRGRMNDSKSYAAPVSIGGVMEGGTVSRVHESRNASFEKGDIVLSHSGWQKWAVSDGSDIRRINVASAPVTTALGILGMPGFTAWAGLQNIARLKEGETLVVAAASGAVGSAVSQIAQLRGARVVAIAGGEAKCSFVRDELRIKRVVDHHDRHFFHELAEACPQGIDVYFENVGGHVWEAVLPLLNPFARVPVCGLISQYNGTNTEATTDGLALTMATILSRSVTVRGFIQREFTSQRDAFFEEVVPWVTAGKVRYKEDIVDGLENAANAFIGMLEGKNFGKLIVRVG